MKHKVLPLEKGSIISVVGQTTGQELMTIRILPETQKELVVIVAEKDDTERVCVISFVFPINPEESGEPVVLEVKSLDETGWDDKTKSEVLGQYGIPAMNPMIIDGNRKQQLVDEIKADDQDGQWSWSDKIQYVATIVAIAILRRDEAPERYGEIADGILAEAKDLALFIAGEADNA